jgi:hypothetical protein
MSAATRPRGRLAWMVAGSVAAIAGLAFGTLQVVGLVARSEEQRHDVVTVPIRHVDIRSGGGGLTILRSPDSSTVIDRKLVRGLTRPHSTFRVDGDRLVVDSRCRGFLGGFCSVDLVVSVPDGAAVTASASGGGIRATDVGGSMVLSASGGGIDVTGGVGPLDLDASGGGVRVQDSIASRVVADASGGGVRLVFARPPSDVDADSSGGGVTVEVPADATAYRVDARASGGGTRVDVRTDPTGERRIKARSGGGGVTVRYPTQQ